MNPDPGHATPEIRTPTVLGYRIFKGTHQDLINAVLNTATNGKPASRVGYLNAAQFNLGESDPAFREQLRSMDLLYADGQSIVWAARREGITLPERLTAADFIGDFMHAISNSGLSLALLGGTPGSVDRFAAYWKGEIPHLEIAFTHHGFFGVSESASMIDSIRKSQANVILVGMGAPRQESFVEQWAATEFPGVLWCVGALFEYGPWGKRRAPAWMRKAGLEWAFRFAQEPRRLARRYLLGNPLFIWRVLKRRGNSGS